MQHKPACRLRFEDVEVSMEARLTAALQHLAYWLNRDEAGDAMIATLAEEISDCLLEDTPHDDGTAEGIERALLDGLNDDYAGNPEACLSFIGSYIASRRQKERSLKK